MSWGILDFLSNDDIEMRTVTSLEYSVPLAGASLVLYYRNVSFSVTQPLFKYRSCPRIQSSKCSGQAIYILDICPCQTKWHIIVTSPRIQRHLRLFLWRRFYYESPFPSYSIVMRIHTKFGDVLHLHIKIRTITVDFTLIIHKTLGKGAKKRS